MFPHPFSLFSLVIPVSSTCVVTSWILAFFFLSSGFGQFLMKWSSLPHLKHIFFFDFGVVYFHWFVLLRPFSRPLVSGKRVWPIPPIPLFKVLHLLDSLVELQSHLLVPLVGVRQVLHSKDHVHHIPVQCLPEHLD